MRIEIPFYNPHICAASGLYVSACEFSAPRAQQRSVSFGHICQISISLESEFTYVSSGRSCGIKKHVHTSHSPVFSSTWSRVCAASWDLRLNDSDQ